MTPEFVSSSTILPVIIIGLALCLVIGPIMLMRPSARQTFLAKLRQEAAQQQLSVAVSVWPERLNAPLGLMRYGLRQPRLPAHLGAAMWVREAYSHEVHLADYWHVCESNSEPVITSMQKQQLEHLLVQWNQEASIKAVGFANGCVYLDWVESSQLTVADIKDRLRKAFDVFDFAP